MSSLPRLLNIGCGNTVHPQWVNLDAQVASPGVTKHDLHRRLPYPADTFDAVYGSHVLEHLDPEEAMRVLRECHRVLAPRGTVRIVVPDLETIARLYLSAFQDAVAGREGSPFKYDWAMLELFDQTVRSATGGRMAAVLARKLEPDEARFVEGRIGAEAMGSASAEGSRGNLAWRVRRRGAAIIEALRRRTALACAFLLLGRRGASGLREGLFRQSGEVHKWMYDRFSLTRALQQAGFVDARVCAAAESSIPGFVEFGLDIRNGRPRKPDSLYMEARKRATT